MEEKVQEIEEAKNVITQHGPHPHALRRILIGVGAVALITVGGVVWAKWGEEIKEACTGKEACKVELPDTTNFTTEFNE